MRSTIRNRRSAIGGRRGFTLLEMVIVIGIIAILAALSLSAITAAARGSEMRETRDTLTLLDNAVIEWERTNDRQMSYGTNNQPAGSRYDVQEVADPTLVADIEALNLRTMSVLSRTASVQEMLTRISGDFFRQQPDGDREVIDSWDKRIVAVFPGRKWVVGDPVGDRDDDDTIRTPFEKQYGVCKNRRVYFMSAGPDGRYGDVGDDVDKQPFKDTQDNVYSYDPIIKK